MSADRQPLIALSRFEFRRAVARQGAWMGFGIFVVAVVVGAVDYRFRDGEPASLFGEGFIIWMMGLIAFGLAIDRRQAFDEYLIRNHTRVAVYILAKVAAVDGNPNRCAILLT